MDPFAKQSRVIERTKELLESSRRILKEIAARLRGTKEPDGSVERDDYPQRDARKKASGFGAVKVRAEQPLGQPL